MSYELITTLLQQTIAYHPVFRDVAGSTVGGVFLSQAYYWSTGGRIAAERSGWFYKTGAQWEAETRLSRSEQERARRDLKAVGLLEEKRQGRPAKLYFRLNVNRLFKLIEALSEGKPALKKPKQNRSLQDSAIKAEEPEKANKNNSMQDSALLPEPDAVKPPDKPEKPNEISSMQDSTSSMQDSASQFAESCKLYTETTTEITSETTADVSGACVSVGGFSDSASPPADVRQRFAMSLDWQPGERFVGLCRTQGVNLSRFDQAGFVDQLGDFRSYWNTATDRELSQGQWEHKFAQQLKRAMLRISGKESHHAAGQSSGFAKPRSGAAILADGCAGAFG